MSPSEQGGDSAERLKLAWLERPSRAEQVRVGV